MTVIFVMEEKSKRSRAHSPPPTSSENLEKLSSDYRHDSSYLRWQRGCSTEQTYRIYSSRGFCRQHCFVLWRIPWTEEPGGLQSMGSQNWTQLKRLSTSAGGKKSRSYSSEDFVCCAGSDSNSNPTVPGPPCSGSSLVSSATLSHGLYCLFLSSSQSTFMPRWHLEKGNSLLDSMLR